MRRSGHPSRPKARICCFWSSPVDYAVAGVEAFLKTYVQQAIVQRFRHDDIPHEQRAIRMETAVRGMLAGSPDLVRAMTSCDGNAILALLQNQKNALRTALNQSM